MKHSHAPSIVLLVQAICNTISIGHSHNVPHTLAKFDKVQMKNKRKSGLEE